MFYNDENVHLVNKIIDKRKRKVSGKLRVEYLIDWLDQYSDPTWIRREDVTEDLIVAFERGSDYRYPFSKPDIRKSLVRYDDLRISKRPTKQICNQTFSRLVNSSTTKRGREYVMVLDGVTMNTSRMLLSEDFNGTIFAVNFDIDIIKSMLLDRPRRCIPKYGSMNQAILLGDEPLLGWWGDYCCTFDGNPISSPKRDVECLFSKRRLLSGSIFALTVCLRDPRKQGHVMKKTAYTVTRKIKTLATRFGYELVKLYRLMYHPSMLCVMYRVVEKYEPTRRHRKI